MNEANAIREWMFHTMHNINFYMKKMDIQLRKFEWKKHFLLIEEIGWQFFF